MSYNKITTKWIMQNLDVSERTARKYFKDLKSHFNTKIILEVHFCKYFNVPPIKTLQQSFTD